MTEFEFLTAIGESISFSVQAAMAFFGVFGAYVVTAYLAGSTFSRVVAICISTLYSMFLTGPLTGIYMNVYEATRLEKLYFAQYPEGVIVKEGMAPEVMLVVIAGPLIFGWVLSLIYMHGYIRKSS